MKFIKKLLRSLQKSIKSKIFGDVYKRLDEQKFVEANVFFGNRSQYYDKAKDLDEVNFKVFSQNGEDGIIDFILYKLNIKIPKFIEIGVGDFSECNTRFIYRKNHPKGLIVDIIKNFSKKVSLVEETWKGGLITIEKKIDPTNINRVLSENNFDNNIDLFSIDIDGIDYWVLKELPKNFSKILVAEYNPYFGDKFHLTVPNIKEFNRTNYHYSELCFGCSLPALIELMEEKNMTFIGSNLFRNNAFFINNEYLKNFNLNKIDKNNLTKFTNARFLESKDKNSKKNYLNRDKILKEIQDCEVIDLQQNKKIKISEILK